MDAETNKGFTTNKISHQIKIPDTRFPKALKLHEAGKFDEAASVYREILIEPPITAMSQEYSLLVSNNYAVAKAESGQYKEAIYLLNLLLHEQGVRKEIVLYNIAQIKKDIGESEEFLKFLNQSFEEDSSLYRVRSPYLLAIDQLVAKHSAVKLIDMDDLISDGMYLDWCHPLPEGQKILANNIAKAFKDFGDFVGNEILAPVAGWISDLLDGGDSGYTPTSMGGDPIQDKRNPNKIVLLCPVHGRVFEKELRYRSDLILGYSS